MADIAGLRKKYEKIEGERFFRELFEDNEYADILTLPLDTVLDVGALAGEFSAYVYDGAGVIYALEPYSKHFDELKENIEEFGLEKVKSYRIALSDRNGTSEFTTDASRGGNRLGSGPHVETVRTRTLATFMGEKNIKHVNLLKIDIEDGEQAVFNAGDFPAVSDKIDAIVGEHLAGLKDRLAEFGFSCHETKGRNLLFTKDA